MCCCLSGEPIQDSNGKIPSRETGNKFQKNMCDAPCANCNSTLWFFAQCCPFTCCVTQCLLRRKVLEYDMTKYACCQGYVNCCCFKAGTCGESNCPDLCLCLESFFCNGCAVSASRLYLMDKYQLSSDPCDYRIIRFNNCIQILACVCSILAIFIAELREIACILDRFADFVYHVVSGCMTAQTAFEENYQIATRKNGGGHVAHAAPYNQGGAKQGQQQGKVQY